MSWIRRKLRNWLFPEAGPIVMFMDEINNAKLRVSGKSITFRNPIVLVGNLDNCTVKVTPKVSNEIVLSHISYDSLLEVSGHQHLVTANVMDAIKEKVIKQ